MQPCKLPTLALATLLAGLAAPSPSHAALLTFGTTTLTGSDCTFACVARLQQDYTAAAFSGPVAISHVYFYTPGYTGNGTSYTYTLSLATNPHGSGLGATFASNLGADASVFASLTLPNTVPAGAIDFAGNFSYNPGLGNLVVDIQRNHISGTADIFGAFNATGTVSRVYNFTGQVAGAQDVTGISTSFAVTALAIPEPSSLVLAIGGLLTLGLFQKGKN